MSRTSFKLLAWLRRRIFAGYIERFTWAFDEDEKKSPRRLLSPIDALQG